MDNLNPDRYYEVAPTIARLTLRTYIEAREKLYTALHEPKVRQDLKLWGVDILYNGGFKVFSPMPYEIPYLLTKED